MVWQHTAAASVFAITFLFLALGRLGRFPIPRGPTALVGGLATKILLVVSWTVIDVQVILLIAALLGLAGLAETAGLFAGVRRRLASRSPWMAMWFSTLLVAVASALLLNDAAIVILVPFLLPALLALGLPPVPMVTLLAVAANVGSLLTPFGNPQNAVLARAADLTVLSFFVHQGPLVLVGFSILGLASYQVARHVVSSSTPLPPHMVPRGRLWLSACVIAFLVVAVTGWYPLGSAAALTLMLAYVGLRPVLGRDADGAVRRGLDFNVLSLFVGLYLLTGGLGSWFPQSVHPTSQLTNIGISTLTVTLLSNVVGNVPAVLMLLRLDSTWTIAHAHFLVTVSTLGGTLLLTGSAASLLAAEQARRFDVHVGFMAFLRTSWVWVVPLLLLGAAWTW